MRCLRPAFIPTADPHFLKYLLVKFPVLKKRPMTIEERRSHGLAHEEVGIHFYTEWVDVNFWSRSGHAQRKSDLVR